MANLWFNPCFFHFFTMSMTKIENSKLVSYTFHNMLRLTDDDFNDAIYEYIVRKTGKLRVNLTLEDRDIRTDLFFDALNENKSADELEIYTMSDDDDLRKLINTLRLPPNITKLSCPTTGSIMDKIKLPPNIEKLTLRLTSDMNNIDFSGNTKLRHLKIEYCRRTDKINIPENVIKLHIESIISHDFVVPSNIRILKLYSIEDVGRIIVKDDSKLEKIIVAGGYNTQNDIEKMADISHLYNLKVIRIRAYRGQQLCSEKMKLPYRTVVEFY